MHAKSLEAKTERDIETETETSVYACSNERDRGETYTGHQIRRKGTKVKHTD